MSNTLDGARSMVRAADTSGKLCQIGYQRRSNPRYRYTLEQLFNGKRIFGQIVNARGQWYRSLASSREIQCKPSLAMRPDILSGYGNTMASCLAWNDLVRRGFLIEKDPPRASNGRVIESRPSRPLRDYELPGDLNKPPHQPHLENFFAAVRGEATLNCDARCAFASEAPVHWVNPSALSHQPIVFANEHLDV